MNKIYTELNEYTADSLDIAFNSHLRLKLVAVVISLWSFWQEWNLISGDQISCKHQPKWNSYAYLSKYWVILKCCKNETSCEQDLFSGGFEILNWYEFISPLIWTYSKGWNWEILYSDNICSTETLIVQFISWKGHSHIETSHSLRQNDFLTFLYFLELYHL